MSRFLAKKNGSEMDKQTNCVAIFLSSTLIQKNIKTGYHKLTGDVGSSPAQGNILIFWDEFSMYWKEKFHRSLCLHITRYAIFTCLKNMNFS